MEEQAVDLSENFDIFDMFSPRQRGIAQVVVASLKALFAGRSLPGYKVKGSPAQINSFLDTLVKEKRYMASVMDNGLNNPQTYRQKAILDTATKNFHRQTGLKWPIGQ